MGLSAVHVLIAVCAVLVLIVTVAPFVGSVLDMECLVPDTAWGTPDPDSRRPEELVRRRARFVMIEQPPWDDRLPGTVE
jgi:hypothetical protein